MEYYLKCDETKPICLRCIKAQRVCTGYRVLLGDTSIRSANNSSPPTDSGNLCYNSTARNHRHIRVVECSECEDWPGIPNLEKLAPKAAYLSEQLVRLARHPELFGCTQFGIVNAPQIYDLWSELLQSPQARTICGGCLTCLPAIATNLSQSSPVYPALFALALAFASLGLGYKQVHPIALASYQITLASLRSLLATVPLANRNETMLTIIILGMYEVCLTPLDLAESYGGAISWSDYA
jgi:hypothetical protein